MREKRERSAGKSRSGGMRRGRGRKVNGQRKPMRCDDGMRSIDLFHLNLKTRA